jgi:hypothetical protein
MEQNPDQYLDHNLYKIWTRIRIRILRRIWIRIRITIKIRGLFLKIGAPALAYEINPDKDPAKIS